MSERFLHKKVSFSTAFRAFHSIGAQKHRSRCASFARVTRRKTPKRDETVRVSPAGFGQHESPICARPRRLAPAITASNFDSMVLLTSLDFRRSPSRSSIAESLITRPSSLPPT